MDLELSNRVVLVAGASRGIGRGIAATMLAEGARVLLTGRDGAALEDARASLATEHGPRVAAHVADMTATAGIVSALDACEAAFDVPEVLVANVGGGYLTPGWDVGDDKLEAALEHNLAGSVRLVREGVRRMQPAAEAEGHPARNIIVISSIAGVDIMGAPFAYGMAKAGLAASRGG